MSCRHECTHTSPSNCRNGLTNPILIFLEDNNDAESAAHEQSHTDIDDRQPAGTLWLLGKTVYSTTSSWVVAVQIKNSIGFIIWSFIYWGCPLTQLILHPRGFVSGIVHCGMVYRICVAWIFFQFILSVVTEIYILKPFILRWNRLILNRACYIRLNV